MKGCKIFLTICLLLFYSFNYAQSGSLTGKILDNDGNPIIGAIIQLKEQQLITTSGNGGNYTLSKIPQGKFSIDIAMEGYVTISDTLDIIDDEAVFKIFTLIAKNNQLSDVVITGTLKEVSRLESPVSVEVYNNAYFKKNPTPNIYDALQNVNGVRPQLNCQVCNTGDIHINGLEGPYTMVLIDGMPIVSSLSSVYGLSGIPMSLIERVEIVKGPASSLYGSEAVGGLINIITQKPQNAPLIAADVMTTTWGEYNTDVALKISAGKVANILTGMNYFNYKTIMDKNHDNFTDLTLQDRISVFQKWQINRSYNRLMSIAARYMYEDRWGGQSNWNKSFRGSDSVYGESIYTNRLELIGNYQLPTTEKLLLAFSYIDHDQNSMYGIMPFVARQRIAFNQLTWDKKLGMHDLLLGTTFRYTYYDDNTPATATADSANPQNNPNKTILPGVFVQDEILFDKQHKLLLGFRYDYNNYHGNIFTPRLAYKWTINNKNIVRLNAGTGFRVVNIFTEDHAALTGAREVVVNNQLRPEKSYNVNLNYLNNIVWNNSSIISIDASVFYTYFNNKIVADYETNSNKIIYDNLSGFAESKGVTLNLDFDLFYKLKIRVGATYMENPIKENYKKEQQILTEKFTGTWSVAYTIPDIHFTIDYTGNVYSPMRLPLLSDNDPRKLYSPWWSLQNIQLSFSGMRNIRLYGGVKNFLNWTPNKGNPFIIARSYDPFDKKVQFDASGNAVPTSENPYGLTFDPTYVYAPNQGIRFFAGVAFSLK